MTRRSTRAPRDTIAYFSMEIGLETRIPTYSGGLGVLAGDTLRAAADAGLPLVGVTLLTRQGYFRQSLDPATGQRVHAEHWDPATQLEPCRPHVQVRLDGHTVHVRAWRHRIIGVRGHEVPVLYVDTDLPRNRPAHRALAGQLYGGDAAHRLRQEWILGVAGVRLLRALGYRHVRTFHLNEGHAAFLTFELIAEALAASGRRRPGKTESDAVRSRCVFTTHTPVPAGHDRFALDDVRRAIGPHPAWPLARRLGGGGGHLNMTHLALALSRAANAVAAKHGEVSRAMFPGHRIDHITNGVHAATWTAPPIARLLDRHVPDWRLDNGRLRHALALPLADLVRAHRSCKDRLLRRVNRRSDVPFEPDVFTVGFARRATAYKRADLLLREPARLRRLVARHGRIQIVFAGKAHPRDEGGQDLIRSILCLGARLGADVPVVYLPNYNIALAQVLIPGVDLWLNTPEPPLEASGTSGMKAALNGVPSLSVLDGWWLEGWAEGLTGWAIDTPSEPGGNPTAPLLRKLGHVVDLYYRQPETYRQIMRNALAVNGPVFNTQRMVEDYVRKVYRT